jgi:ribA/ribD-fused uncharacterized protein
MTSSVRSLHVVIPSHLSLLGDTLDDVSRKVTNRVRNQVQNQGRPGSPGPAPGGAAGWPEPRTAAEVAALVAAGVRPEWVMFWRHGEGRGAVDAGCLSQWHPAGLTVDGVRYATAEHWMMAGKARLFGDGEALAQVLAAPHPRAAKGVGQRVRGFDEQVWREHRVELVVRGNVAKFGQHPQLRAFLLATAGRILVEASPLDRIWGIGLGADDERAADPARWRGLNLLGFALMEARARLAAG